LKGLVSGLLNQYESSRLLVRGSFEVELCEVVVDFRFLAGGVAFEVLALSKGVTVAFEVLALSEGVTVADAGADVVVAEVFAAGIVFTGAARETAGLIFSLWSVAGAITLWTRLLIVSELPPGVVFETKGFEYVTTDGNKPVYLIMGELGPADSELEVTGIVEMSLRLEEDDDIFPIPKLLPSRNSPLDSQSIMSAISISSQY
jgi:hypothetical protein